MGHKWDNPRAIWDNPKNTKGAMAINALAPTWHD